MSALMTDRAVGQLVAERPARSRVFEKLGIDYCCGGKKSLEDACRDKGLDARTIAALLEASEGAPATAEVDPQAMSLTELADHIEQTHHAYLRRELPRLAMLVRKVAAVHGHRYPWMLEVDGVFAGFMAELDSHMMKEEQILFPIVREVERGNRSAGSHCGGLANPIRVMEHEHDSAGNALAAMRRLTDGFTPSADACNTFRAMLDGLAELERDMHQHVHKENNVLFPRALELEAA